MHIYIYIYTYCVSIQYKYAFRQLAFTVSVGKTRFCIITKKQRKKSHHYIYTVYTHTYAYTELSKVEHGKV